MKRMTDEHTHYANSIGKCHFRNMCTFSKQSLNQTEYTFFSSLSIYFSPSRLLNSC